MIKLYSHLNEEFLTEMTEIGKYDGMRILIYGGEGPIPHFYFKSSTIDECLRLDVPGYFQHGNHKDMINYKELKKKN